MSFCVYFLRPVGDDINLSSTLGTNGDIYILFGEQPEGNISRCYYISCIARVVCIRFDLLPLLYFPPFPNALAFILSPLLHHNRFFDSQVPPQKGARSSHAH